MYGSMVNLYAHLTEKVASVQQCGVLDMLHPPDLCTRRHTRATCATGSVNAEYLTLLSLDAGQVRGS